MAKIACVVAAVLALGACSSTTTSPRPHATTAAPATAAVGRAGALRAVVAFVGDSNLVDGATALSLELTPSAAGYVPMIAAAVNASVRWNGCFVETPERCPHPEATDYWSKRIAQLRERVDAHAWVVDLGINDAAAPGTPTTPGYAEYDAKIDDLLAGLPSDRPIFWTTLPCAIEVQELRTGCAIVNRALVAAPARHANLEVLPWGAAAQRHPEYMDAGSAKHYSAAGQAAYAAFVRKALDLKLG